MKQKIFFNLLTLCVVLTVGTGILSEENIEELPNLHVRKKRVVDRSPYGVQQVTLWDAPYIVNIKLFRAYKCAGTILAADTILTSAECITNTELLSVWSGTSFINRGYRHNIVGHYRHPEYRNRFENNLGILKISPPITLGRMLNHKIGLHNGRIAPNSFATISGWGCAPEDRIHKTFFKELRSINVPIISEEQCNRFYRNISLITNKEICTLDRTAQRGTGYGDTGAPLVVGHQLLGVMAWTRGFLTGVSPDVFVNLSHPLYRDWILSLLPNP